VFFLSNRYADLSARLVRKLAFSNYEQITKRNRFENIFAVTNGVQSIMLGVIGALVTLFSDIILILIMFIGLLVVDPTIALSNVLFFGVVALVLYRLINRNIVELISEESRLQIKNGQLLYELFGLFKETFAGGTRELYVNRLEELKKRQAFVAAKSKFMSDVSKYVMEVFFVLGALCFVGIQFILNDAGQAVSSISIFIASASRITPAILRLQNSAISLRSALGISRITLTMIEELKGFGDYKVERTVLSHTRDKFKGQIRIEDVTFAYRGKPRYVLENVNIKVAEGDWIAIVGPSGAGKSTLINLLLGVLKPTVGKVDISGLEPELATTNWPGKISYVPQDSFILQGSVKDNVALGVEEEMIDEDKVKNCLAKVGLLDLFLASDKGIDTEVGELGSKLSGGQKQRLGIARALYTKPKLLILDEATSSLDNISEQKILECLREIQGKTTIISIAHRLSTVINADKVIYMENGKVVSIGTFDQVRRRVPNFDSQVKLSKFAKNK
jgi:ABC-type multidrug transport system fused ATPase/permease subunit